MDGMMRDPSLKNKLVKKVYYETFGDYVEPKKTRRMKASRFVQWNNKKLRDASYFEVFLFKAFINGSLYQRTILVRNFGLLFNEGDQSLEYRRKK